MAKLGGSFGYAVLAWLTKRIGNEGRDYTSNDPFVDSHLEERFGKAVFERFAGKTVVDFGCGRGADAVLAALNGAGRVIGVDTNAEYLDASRRLADKHGVADRCSFVHPQANEVLYQQLEATVDYVYSVDAFEHFQDPAAALREIYRLLRPGGSLLANFGPPWCHPYGAHMGHYNRMPWIHFLFTERTILAVRELYESDGATCFEETSAGVNRMTVRRFQRLVVESPFTCVSLNLTPVRGLRWFTANLLTREYFTSEISCELMRPAEARERSRS